MLLIWPRYLGKVDFHPSNKIGFLLRISELVSLNTPCEPVGVFHNHNLGNTDLDFFGLAKFVKCNFIEFRSKVNKIK